MPATTEHTEHILNYRIGHGYDVHRLTADRPLILGGVSIPYSRGLLGHSDADVLLHAIADAFLGALALGDIGMHFPDTDPQYKGADSLLLLQHVVELVNRHGYQLNNLDAVLIAQKPKLAAYLPAMRENIARVCGADMSQVSLKATTEERLGFTGREEGIAAHCVLLLSACGCRDAF